MYICVDCNCIFDNPIKYIERHGLDSPPYEEYKGCPKCGGYYITAYTCNNCQNYILHDYIKLPNNERYCDNCYKWLEAGDEDII